MRASGRAMVLCLCLLLPWLALVAATRARPLDPPLLSEHSLVANAPFYFWHSLQVAAAACIGALVLGLLAAAGLNARLARRASSKVPTVHIAFMALPMLLPVYVMATGWDACFSRWPPGSGVLHTTAGAGLVLGACWFPLVAFAILAALARADPERIEAAAQLGGWRARARVITAEIAPAAGASLCVVGTLALVEPLVPHLYRLTNPSLDVLAGEILTDLGIHRDALVAMIAAWPLHVGGSLLILAAVFLAQRMPSATRESGRTDSMREPVDREPGASLSPRAARARRASFWSFVAILPVLAALAPPLIGHAIAAHHGGAGTFTTLKDHLDAAATSALVAGGAVLLALLPALAIGSELARKDSTRLRIAGIVLMLAIPACIPAGIPALGVLRFHGRGDTLALVAIAQALVILPFLSLLFWAALARVPSRTAEEARMLGASALAAFLRSTLPRASGGLALGALAGFLIAFAEVQATSVMRPPGARLLGPLILDLAHYGTAYDLATLSLMAVAITLAAMTLFALAASSIRIARRTSS